MSTQIAIKQSQLQNWAIVIKECKESGLKVADFCNQCIRPLSAAIRAAFSGQTGPY